eukprot:TRINITY_DN4806_c0_g1_i1.p1 TRINITY_DN4806_c0_g1~~TRINITY_DN4806_c0_g1_i1.p1  ORF type:complete len:206 (+),score=27.04 TRINITY_DN4806_c0_g1_i1:227-844(+)
MKKNAIFKNASLKELLRDPLGLYQLKRFARHFRLDEHTSVTQVQTQIKFMDRAVKYSNTNSSLERRYHSRKMFRRFINRQQFAQRTESDENRKENESSLGSSPSSMSAVSETVEIDQKREASIEQEPLNPNTPDSNSDEVKLDRPSSSRDPKSHKFLDLPPETCEAIRLQIEEDPSSRGIFDDAMDMVANLLDPFVVQFRNGSNE